MFVHQVYTDTLHFGPEIIEFITAGTRAGATYNLHIRVFRTDGFCESFEAFYINLVPLFITDADHLQIEGFGMSHIGTHLSPLGSNRAVGKFNQVECILYVRIELIHRDHFVAFVLAGEPAADYRKRFCTEVFAQQEVFEVTKSQSLEIVREGFMFEGVVPAVFIQRAVFNRAYGILPLVTGFKTVTLDDTTTGETEYAGVKVIKGLCKVGTQTILTSFPSIHREQGDMIHIYRTLCFEDDTQASMSVCERRFQHHRQLLPVIAADFDFFLQQILCIGVDELDGELHRLRIRCAGINGETVFFALLHTDAAVTFIIQSGTQQASVVHYAYIVRIAVKTRICILNGYITERYPTHERLWKFKRTVLYQFGI